MGLWLCAAALPATAEPLVSPSFRLEAHRISAATHRFAQSSVPGGQIGGSGLAVGQADALGPSAASLGTPALLPAFWPIVAGALPALDGDGDGLPRFADSDDDNDGLPDTVETNTGTFLSETDTGTHPLLADSDSDGFDDGVEVLAGTDPNDPGSFPNTAPLPGLPPLGVLVVAAGLTLIGSRKLRTSRL